MSDPTYRIDVEAVVGEPWSWWAKVYRLSDARYLNGFGGETSDAAIRAAQEWIAAESQKAQGFSVYVFDDGQPVEARSVKV